MLSVDLAPGRAPRLRLLRLEATFRAAGDYANAISDARGFRGRFDPGSTHCLSWGWPVPAAASRARRSPRSWCARRILLGLVIALRRGLLRISAPAGAHLPTIIRIGAALSLAGVLLSVIYMCSRDSPRVSVLRRSPRWAWAIDGGARVHRDQRLRARRRRATSPRNLGAAGGAGAGSGCGSP